MIGLKIIFTDIDGVLNPHWRKSWSKNSISIFNRICRDFNLKPVITSTWRTNHTINQLQDIFTEQGIEIEIYDYTPVLEQTERGLEIKQWLSNNHCDNYVVVDDKVSDIEQHVSNVVKCQSWVGLTEESYNDIKEILK